MLPISAVGNKKLKTIEGSYEDKNPLLEAWRTLDVPQCGYCQAGQIMNAAALLASNPTPSD